AGVERKAGLIRALRGNASGSAFRRRLRRLDELRQAHRKGYALAHLAGLGGVGVGHLAFLLQPAKESVEALLQKLLPEHRVGASARRSVSCGKELMSSELWGRATMPASPKH